MSYTRIWRTNVSGNRPKNQMDDAQREIREDVEDRMQGLFSGLADWTADPVDPGASFYHPLHWSAFRFTPAMGPATGAESTLSTKFGVRAAAGGTPSYSAQLPLPLYGTLVDVVFSCHTGALTQIVFTVYKLDYSDPENITRTTLATRTITASTGQANFSVSSGANINDAITPDSVYYATVAFTNSSGGAVDHGFQGATLQYTRGVFQHV